MNFSSSKLDLLRDIVQNLARQEHKLGPFTERDLAALPFTKAKIAPQGILGIKVEGAKALYELADSIFNASALYRRGTTFEDLFDTVGDTIIINFIDRKEVEPGSNDLAFVEDAINSWFQGRSATHQLYVPCILTRYFAPSFSLGPVQFTHIEEFVTTKRAKHGQGFDFEFGPLLEDMNQNSARWMAIVEVDNCTKERAWEIGELAVDIALAGIQLALPLDKGCMSRMTGRTIPRLRRSVSYSDGEFSGVIVNQEPALRIGPGRLEVFLDDAGPLLTSVGLRIRSFLQQNGTLPGLELAWADAAYWFLEGLSEPLDTIAVPKLETAIEVLLRAESTSGSERRMIRAMHAFYGLTREQFLNPLSKITVGLFAKDLVRDRSRILHGTWSTLSHPLHQSRGNLTMFVYSLLIKYVLEIDRYAATQNATDDVEKFLENVTLTQTSSSLDEKKI